jgi:hypothetical protein
VLDRPVHRLAARHAIPLLLAVGMTGCGPGWLAVPAPIPERFEPRQVVQVWSRSHAAQLHGLVVTPDSILGVGYLAPVDCDSCRVGFLRSDVDSLRTGDPTNNFWGTAALVTVGALALIVVLCGRGSGFCPGGIAGN